MITGYSNIISVTTLPGLLLDVYPSAAAAYSLRKLRTAYTGSAIRVRRSSDNTEQDISFDINGNLDTSALTTFCNGSTGLVTTWYDQSGNGNNATQSTAGLQPQIVISGVILTINGKPKIDFNNNPYFNITSFTFNAANYNSFVGKREASGRILAGLLGTQYNWALWSDDIYNLQANSAAYQQSSSTDTSTTYSLLTGLRESGGLMKMYKNSSLIASTSTVYAIQQNINKIGWYELIGNAKTFGILQEIVFYNSAQESNRTGIENNINSYYAIY